MVVDRPIELIKPFVFGRNCEFNQKETNVGCLPKRVPLFHLWHDRGATKYLFFWPLYECLLRHVSNIYTAVCTCNIHFYLI